MYVGGMSQRDIESSLESAVGQFVFSKSMVSEMTETLSEESEAWRMWDVRNELVATLLLIEMMNHYDAGGRRPECSVAGPLSGWGQRLLESLHLLPPYHFTETGGLDLNQYNMPPPPG